MKNWYFDIVVKKTLKHKNKIITIDKIKNILSNILDEEYNEKKAYKVIHHMKNRWYLINLKKSIFLVKDPEKEISEETLIENNYRTILKKHCKDFTNNKRYIGWIKALELNLNNFEIPEEILLINDTKQSTETIIFDKQVMFKTYINKKKNLFSQYKKFTHKIKIWVNTFTIANTELALLESLYNPSIISEWYTKEIIKKILRKNKKELDTSIRLEILKTNKHHSSINRLYKISSQIDPVISEKIKEIIKKYSYFM